MKPKIVFSAGEIHGRVGELASQISRDYKNKPLLMVGVLKGAFIFLSDLVRQMDHPSLLIDFIQVSSYQQGTESGSLRLIKDVERNISDLHVLIVEDIVDTGYTLSYLKELLNSKGPMSLKTCCLLDKPFRRKINISPDYSAFSLQKNVFILGYGLDLDEQYRHLPYLFEIEEEI